MHKKKITTINHWKSLNFCRETLKRQFCPVAFFPRVFIWLNQLAWHCFTSYCGINLPLKSTPRENRCTWAIDCIYWLNMSVGRANYWPGPNEIIHFDVLLPLLKILHEWPGSWYFLKWLVTLGAVTMKWEASAGLALDDSRMNHWTIHSCWTQEVWCSTIVD